MGPHAGVGNAVAWPEHARNLPHGPCRPGAVYQEGPRVKEEA
jgi:hypothetical protein